tara:strand:+ start:1660 stop:1875 length:216 start_codon:yes stop_codon:yes gene_type:complete
MTDLEFVESKNLIKELQKRHDEMVIIGAVKRTGETEDLTVAFAGSYHACVGLMEIGKLALMGGTSDENYSD